MNKYKYNLNFLIFGMPRSGTTLLTDLLTVPGKSFVFLEPNLEWNPAIFNHFKNYGLKIDHNDWNANKYGSFWEFFELKIYPQLKNLDLLGAKIVKLDMWQHYYNMFNSKKIIICVRDIRDLSLSFLDLAEKQRMLGAKERNEDWAKKRLLFTIKELIKIAKMPHFLIKYEDLCTNPKTLNEILKFVGLEKCNFEPFSLSSVPIRSSEIIKHEGKISNKSINRYLQETSKSKIDFANQIYKESKEYSKIFFYEI